MTALSCIFAPCLCMEACTALHQHTPGLTGFDSRMKLYVSMQSVGDLLYNISHQKIIWRKQLRSRCLIEVQ